MRETEPHLTPRQRAERVGALATAWTAVTANERASFQTWLLAFCRALGVESPDPPSDDYRFELPVRAVDREGRESTNYIDCWKAGHVAIEAKAFAEGRNTDAQLRKAYGQLRNYIAHVSGDAPPYLMVVDVPRTLIVWDRWSGAYGDFAAGRRIALASLHERPDDAAYSEYGWRFGEPRRELRTMIARLPRFIVTPVTAKHRVFAFLSGDNLADDGLVVVAMDDAYSLGVLSSTVHVTWALASGGELETRPRYLKSRCFDPFPFPAETSSARLPINSLAERLDAHRKQAIARDERVTMTGMYNVVEKLRSGAQLTPKERAVDEIAACGVLRELHDELDAKVAEAYGWPWPMEKEEILERLVALHDERVEEERRGIIRWLRPDYQIPRFAPQTDAGTQGAFAINATTMAAEMPPALPAWPPTAVEQFAAITSLLATRALTLDQVAAAFSASRRDLIERHLETLALMGEVTRDGDGRYQAARKAA